MKKILALSLTISLFLTACSSSTTTGTTSNSDTPHYIDYKTGDFDLQVPDDWERITSFSSDYPAGIRVAFKNNLKNSDFVANVTIIREDNTNNLTSYDYTQSKLAEHQDHLLDYELVSQEELTLHVGSATSVTTLNTFTGKNDASNEPLEFMQTALTKGDRAWVITATYAPNEDEFVIDRMTTMLKSFQLE